VAFARACVRFAEVGLKAGIENTRIVENKKCRGYGQFYVTRNALSALSW
jgi:hypothetical protein